MWIAWGVQMSFLYNDAYRHVLGPAKHPWRWGYPKETVIAEKLEALTAIGLLNSRMKDFYDLALLSRMYPFDGERLG